MSDAGSDDGPQPDSIILTGECTYLSWRSRITAYLVFNDLDSIVEGRYAFLASDTRSCPHPHWIQHDQHAWGAIDASISHWVHWALPSDLLTYQTPTPDFPEASSKRLFDVLEKRYGAHHREVEELQNLGGEFVRRARAPSKGPYGIKRDNERQLEDAAGYPCWRRRVSNTLLVARVSDFGVGAEAFPKDAADEWKEEWVRRDKCAWNIIVRSVKHASIFAAARYMAPTSDSPAPFASVLMAEIEEAYGTRPLYDVLLYQKIFASKMQDGENPATKLLEARIAQQQLNWLGTPLSDATLGRAMLMMLPQVSFKQFVKRHWTKNTVEMADMMWGILRYWREELCESLTGKGTGSGKGIGRGRGGEREGKGPRRGRGH